MRFDITGLNTLSLAAQSRDAIIDNVHQLIMRNESIMYQSAIGEVLTRKRANRQETLSILTHRTIVGDWIEGRSAR